MSIPDSGSVTDALILLIETAGARPVGDGTIPGEGDPPFAVVYQLPGGDTWGPDYTAPQAAVTLAYQVTYVDVSRAGAEAFAGLVRHAILDRDADGAFVTPMPLAGLVVLDRAVSYGGGSFAPDRASYPGAADFPRGVFNLRDTFQIHVTLT